MKLKLLAITLIVSSSAVFIPTQNAQAFWGGGWMPWNWFRDYPYYGGYYPYGYPYYNNGYYPYGNYYYPSYNNGYYPYGGYPPYYGWW